MFFIVILNPSLDDTKLKLIPQDCHFENVFTCKTIWEDPEGESCKIYQDNNYCTDKGSEFKNDSDPSHFIFEINVGKRRIRLTTTLNLNDVISIDFELI